jgi:hypothetical protein
MRHTHFARLALAFIALLFFAIPRAVWAQSALENPPNGGPVSGIGTVSGWKCTAGTLTYTVDNGPSAQLAYGISRDDTKGSCGDSANGFIAQQNWNLTGDGQHTIRLFDNGAEFAEATFTVTTLGTEYLTGVTRVGIAPEFPNANTTTYITWQESAQNFVIAQVVPNSAFPNLSGIYQVAGTETHTGCTNPAHNGTDFYQGRLPLLFQVGPEFRGNALLSYSTGHLVIAAVSGDIGLSGSMAALVISDTYTSDGTYLGNVHSVFSGNTTGYGFEGTYVGQVLGETCIVNGSVSAVRS